VPKPQTLIAPAYSAFNHRDIDSALALMSENVSWPKASEGGRVVGKEEIRESGGVNLAMEFVDGVTLGEKIHGERTELKKLLNGINGDTNERE
jgi:hypothetical protein